jgi:iron-sulfur cluster assembly protein
MTGEPGHDRLSTDPTLARKRHQKDRIMINVTPAAAAQIRKAADESNSHGMCLRLAARLEDDGSIEYGMGFDERADDDIHVVSEGIDVIYSPASKELFSGATLDFVEINPGEHRFIFINPNDPSHTTATAQSK